MIDPVSPLAAAGVGAATRATPTLSDSFQIRPATSGSPAMDFEAVLGKLITDTANALRTAEATSIRSVLGRASVQETVEAVLSAEQALQIAIAIRDKVVAAYLEVSRMAI